MICRPRLSVRSKAMIRLVKITFTIEHKKTSCWFRGDGKEEAQGLTSNVSEAVCLSALRVSSRISCDINVSLEKTPSNSIGSTPVLG